MLISFSNVSLIAIPYFVLLVSDKYLTLYIRTLDVWNLMVLDKKTPHKQYIFVYFVDLKISDPNNC